MEPAEKRQGRLGEKWLMHRRTDPRSPVQAVRNRWWAPFLLALLAALGVWTWQQRRLQDDQPSEIHSPPAQLAKANLPALFSTDDYPVEAIKREEQGTVSFQLAINRRGRVSKCSIVGSSGSKALDQATCSILKTRARFAPARDEQGKRVPDNYSGRVRWELPDERNIKQRW